MVSATLAQKLRVDAVRASSAAKSGHPTSSLSAADLLGGVLLDDHFRYDVTRPDRPDNDHLIFSKGHASPLLYAVYKAIGAIADEELLSFRRVGSRLEGHPTPAPDGGDQARPAFGVEMDLGAVEADQPRTVGPLTPETDTAEIAEQAARRRGGDHG
jgi:transketolase